MSTELIEQITETIRTTGAQMETEEFVARVVGEDNVYTEGDNEVPDDESLIEWAVETDGRYSRPHHNVLVGADWNGRADDDATIGQGLQDIMGALSRERDTIWIFMDPNSYMGDVRIQAEISTYRVVIIPCNGSGVNHYSDINTTYDTAHRMDVYHASDFVDGYLGGAYARMTDTYGWRLNNRESVAVLSSVPATGAGIGLIPSMWEWAKEQSDFDMQSTRQMTDEATQVADVYTFIRASLSTIRENITEDRDRLRNRETEADQFMSSWVTTRRSIDQLQHRIRSAEGGMMRSAVQSLSGVQSALAAVDEHPGIKDVRLNGARIEVEINPYVIESEDSDRRSSDEDYGCDCAEMLAEDEDHCEYHGCTCGCHDRTMRVRFEEATATLDISKTGPERITSIRGQHPHVSPDSGRPCFGGAAAMLSDAVSRQDWHSFITIMLGWWTQYNSGDPYNRLPSYTETTEPVGWVQ